MACRQILETATLSDSPVYPIRALTIDTSRSFLPLESLRRTIDAMAMNKLNTLHWHVTDTQSFPIEVASEPRMAQYGAYSPEQVYSAQEVAQLVQYGRQRGVRLMPELDAPAHVGYGWQWGEQAGLGRLAVCVGEVSACTLSALWGQQPASFVLVLYFCGTTGHSADVPHVRTVSIV